MAIGVMCCVLGGCNDQDAKTSWNDVTKKCAVSDLNGPHILYFGPSNVLGPGTIWRQADDHSLHVRYDLNDLPGTKDFMTPGNNSPCDGTSSTTFGFQAAADLTASPLAVSAGVSNDLKKATDVTVKATSMRWDTVREGPYEAYVNALPHDSMAYKEMKAGHRLVITRALRISGFSATMTFKSSDVAGLKATYDGPLGAGVTGKLNGSLNASWSSDGKLTLTAANDFYIAGELRPYSQTGLQQHKLPLSAPAVTIPKTVKLGRDKVVRP